MQILVLLLLLLPRYFGVHAAPDCGEAMENSHFCCFLKKAGMDLEQANANGLCHMTTAAPTAAPTYATAASWTQMGSWGSMLHPQDCEYKGCMLPGSYTRDDRPLLSDCTTAAAAAGANGFMLGPTSCCFYECDDPNKARTLPGGAPLTRPYTLRSAPVTECLEGWFLPPYNTETCDAACEGDGRVCVHPDYVEAMDVQGSESDASDLSWALAERICGAHTVLNNGADGPFLDFGNSGDAQSMATNPNCWRNNMASAYPTCSQVVAAVANRRKLCYCSCSH